MRWLWNDPDGGKESNSRMFGLEIKRLFSVLVLSFDGRSREAFHTHAFNSVSWLLAGVLFEHFKHGLACKCYLPGWRPIVTRRSTFHQVHSTYGKSWALTLRGPWDSVWLEYRPTARGDAKHVRLTHGRKELP